MPLSPRISKLVRAYRATESDESRGPRFKDVALALEDEMRVAPGVSDAVLVECFGPPDLWCEGAFVYFFDHEVPGRNRDEWFFLLADGKVTTSAYNWREINDFSRLKTRQDWPQRDA
jgi:hypothetical protein